MGEHGEKGETSSKGRGGKKPHFEHGAVEYSARPHVTERGHEPTMDHEPHPMVQNQNTKGCSRAMPGARGRGWHGGMGQGGWHGGMGEAAFGLEPHTNSSHESGFGGYVDGRYHDRHADGYGPQGYGPQGYGPQGYGAEHRIVEHGMYDDCGSPQRIGQPHPMYAQQPDSTMRFQRQMPPHAIHMSNSQMQPRLLPQQSPYSDAHAQGRMFHGADEYDPIWRGPASGAFGRGKGGRGHPGHTRPYN